MCVAQTQLYQCCRLPDGSLNHPQLLKYHGNFCKCRNARHSTVARFQLVTLHSPHSFALLLLEASLLSSCTPEAAAPAPAVPRTSWPWKASLLPEHRWLLQPIARLICIPFPFAFQKKQPPLDRNLSDANCIFPKVFFTPENVEGKQHALAVQSQQYHVKQ